MNSKTLLAAQILEMSGRAARTTDRTWKVIELSVYAAEEFGDAGVDSRHLLCGVMREGKGVAAYVLKRLDFTCAAVESKLLLGKRTELLAPNSVDNEVSIVLQTAADFASSMKHNFIGTEHLLLGFMVPQTKSFRLLAELGIDYESVNRLVRGLLGVCP